MFFAWRRAKEHPSGASEPSPPPPAERIETDRERQRWRSAARRVAVAWDDWLAGDTSERDRLYTIYAAALAEEERAAAALARVTRREPGSLECGVVHVYSLWRRSETYHPGGQMGDRSGRI